MPKLGIMGHGCGAAIKAPAYEGQGQNLYTMTVDNSSASKHGTSGGKAAKTGEGDRPDWALGLRRLYDSVVEEDLPDNFKDLLSQLDSKD